MVITLLAAMLAATGPDKIDFQLGWQQGDEITYVVRTETGLHHGEGLMVLAVEKVVDSAISVRWPEIGRMRRTPYPAGSHTISTWGRLGEKEEWVGASGFLSQMALPKKPIAVGAEFQISYRYVDGKIDLTGKLVMVDESKGKTAHFALEGTLTSPDGLSTAVRQQSVFDISRGLFISSKLELDFGGLWVAASFKLAEDGFKRADWPNE